MTLIDPNLGGKIDDSMHAWDSACDLTWENMKNNLDHYFAAHFINWFMAAIIMRDPLPLHIWSIYDEFIELSAQHKLPHFAECWWDHIFGDVLLTNTPGIILGMMLVRYMGWKEYDWFGRKGKSSIFDWDMFHW